MFAEAICETLNVKDLIDMTSADPSEIAEYDLLILGTPVHGFNPSKESVEFVKNIPETENKKAILFCTCRLWKGSVFGKLKKELKNKGYNTVLCVDAKAKEFTKENFAEPVKKIEKKLKE